MKLRHLPADDKTNGWSAILAPRTPREPLRRGVKVEWLVLGAGFVGLAAARRLSDLNPSTRIALVDSGTIGNNASGRNSGFGNYVPHAAGPSAGAMAKALSYRRLTSAGADMLEDLVRRYAIECEWRRAGKYHCAVSAKAERALQAYVAALERFGDDCVEFGRDDLEARLGTRYYRRGVYNSGCVLLNPAALCRGLADSLPENVALHENTLVSALEIGADEVKATTAHGTVTASRLVLATNAFAQQLGYFSRETFPVVSFGSLTTPLTPEQQRRYGPAEGWGVTTVSPLIGPTMRYTDDHRILVRQGFVYTPSFQVTDAQRDFALKSHRRVLAARFPQIGDVGIEHFWMGTMAMTRDVTTRWGQIAPNVFTSAGCNGAGVVKQTVMGSLLADLALRQDNALIADALALGPPRKMPPRPLMDLGVRMHMVTDSWRWATEF